jgi:hypothetical protein
MFVMLESTQPEGTARTLGPWPCSHWQFTVSRRQPGPPGRRARTRRDSDAAAASHSAAAGAGPGDHRDSVTRDLDRECRARK